MSFNPFEQRAESLESHLMSLSEMYPKPYDKRAIQAYTRVRQILMNGTEFESNWFLHQFSRNCTDNELRREIALLRRSEQQQQKLVACLKPKDETILETTIGYEQVAVDLTALLAKAEPDEYVRQALNFALLEDFDHLYRYADLLDLEQGEKSLDLVGGYTEIMPGRPTISEHRHPFDDIRRPINAGASLSTKLHVHIITAAEQQTMNYYMNVAPIYTSDLGRRLYSEIAMIEEQHVSHYGSLLDPTCTWLENNLMHQYTECYLYYSCYNDETDPQIKSVWEKLLSQEISHLHKAAELLSRFENKDYRQLIPDGTFPQLLNFSENKAYIREVLKSVNMTSQKEDYADICDIPSDYEYFTYQQSVIPSANEEAAHNVIEDYISAKGEDYRFEEMPHPVIPLRDRNKDNVSVGRVQQPVDIAAMPQGRSAASYLGMR